MTEVLTLGEAMASLRATGPVRLGGTLRLSVAGSESNVAIGLARLGHRVAWVGVTGDDELGRLVLRTLRAEGVAIDGCRVLTGARTGIVLFEPQVPGVTRVDYHREGSAGSRLGAADVTGKVTSSLRLLHVTGITPALGPGPREAVLVAIAEARANGVPVSFDVNYRRSLWDPETAASTMAPLMEHVDLLFAAADELRIVAPGAPDPVAHLRDRGVREVIVHAADGATVHSEAGAVREAAVPVTAVDTVGAGDAFVTGYLSGTLDGLTTHERLRRAVATAACAVATAGDWEGLPTRGDLAVLSTEAGGAVR